MIKKTLLVLVLCLLIVQFISISSATASYEAYYFENFNVDVIVDENYIFHITETIDTVFTEERHGIYRHLPNYWGEERVKYTEINVVGAPFIINHDRYSTNIRIGDASKEIIGDITYTISYTVNLPKDPSRSMDAVYLNLIGHDHPTETYNSNITITLPKKVDPGNISVVTGYYYGYGYEYKITYEYIDRQTLHIILTEPLESYEGMTVKMNLPQGYFEKVRNPFFLDEFLKYFIPVFLIAIALIIWLKYGNDDTVVIPVEVSPPDVSPIEAGFIIDGEINDYDISSMIIYWASLGFIKIEKVKGKNKYNFYKLKPIEKRPKYEIDIFNSIFPDTEDNKPINTDTLKRRLGNKISSFKLGILAKYNKGTNTLIDSRSKKVSVINVLLAYICFSLVAFFIGSYYHVGLGVFLALLSALLFIPLHLILNKLLKYINKRTPGKNAVHFILYAGFVLLYSYIFSITARPWVMSFQEILFIIVSACVLIIIAFYTKKLSDYGHELFERVLGFRHFLLTAEKDWIEELAMDTPEYFYNMLPYALVLGVSSVWIGKFAKSVQVPPDWYQSTSKSTNFSSRSFSSGFVADFSKIGTLTARQQRHTTSYYSGSSSYTRSYSYRPSTSYSRSSSSSSFSSSRGSSGGGFGGGGSSSW